MATSASTPSVGTDTLYAVIGAIAEGPDLDRVLPAVVDLLVEATSCHACFVYLREDDVLRLRAASPVFAHAVDRVALRMDEGLAGWVARHRTPAFIREAALDDPRMKYVPELEEERFQSMVAVPLADRHGDVIGVVVLHTRAPREFSQDVLEFLVHVASLVVGAIDNARLYEQTRRQVAALSGLTGLSQELASLTGRAELYAVGCAGIARLLEADGCRLLLLDAHGAPVEMAAVPEGAPPDDEPLLHAASDGRLTARLLDGDRAFGMVAVARALPFSADDARLLEASANQLGLALRKVELIERLAGENLVRDVFDALEHGSARAAAARARAAGWDPRRPHVVVVGAAVEDPAHDLGPELDRRLRFVAPDALIDVSGDRLRALVPLPPGDGRLDALHERLAAIGADVRATFGIGRPRQGLGEDVRSLGEATDAMRVASALDDAGGARRFADLGAYRYLVAYADAEAPDALHARAIATLEAYDAQRGTQLVATLARHLAERGGVRASARALMVHPNTLRQRLQRIEELTGLELEREDLLSLEIALKVHRLQRPAPAR